MKCTKCGHNITNKQVFCSACGAEAPELPPNKPFSFKIVLGIALALSVIVNIALLLPSRSSSQQSFPQQIEGEGFSSPEAAITAYIEAFKDGDVDEMVSTFAIESYIECFNFERYIQKTPTLFSTAILLPNSNAHNKGTNKYCRLYEVSNCVRYGFFDLIGIEYNRAYHLMYDEKGREDLIEQLNALDLQKKLSQMKVGDVLTEEDFEYDKYSYDGQISYMLSYLNVTDLRDVAVELEIGGEEYYLFMLTANINGKWYNIRTSGLLGRLVGDQNNHSGFVKR